MASHIHFRPLWLQCRLKKTEQGARRYLRGPAAMQVRRDGLGYGMNMKISESTPEEIHRKWHDWLLGVRNTESRTMEIFILGNWAIGCPLYRWCRFGSKK